MTIPETLRSKYGQWWFEVLDTVERDGSTRVMLNDELIGELYLRDGKLHWKQLKDSELEPEIKYG